MIQCSQDLYRDTWVDVSSSFWLVMPALVCCVDDWPASLPELSHKCLRNMRLPLYRGCVNRVEWCVEIGEHVFFWRVYSVIGCFGCSACFWQVVFQRRWHCTHQLSLARNVTLSLTIKQCSWAIFHSGFSFSIMKYKQLTRNFCINYKQHVIVFNQPDFTNSAASLGHLQCSSM